MYVRACEVLRTGSSTLKYESAICCKLSCLSYRRLAARRPARNSAGVPARSLRQRARTEREVPVGRVAFPACVYTAKV